MNRIRPIVHVAYWIVLIGSLVPLAPSVWSALQHGLSDPGLRFIYIVRDGVPFESWGLTFVGRSGHMLLLAEFAVVAAAAVLSLLAAPTARRIGLALLVLWAGLWFGNALRASLIAPGLWIFHGVTLGAAVFLALAIARAAYRWPARPRRAMGKNAE
jgi:hypothetical protein